ncbi:hypothetical protein [Rhodococcus koreensis]
MSRTCRAAAVIIWLGSQVVVDDRGQTGTPCGCGRTFTLSDADYPDMRMPFQHGTLAWEASYHRRVGIESLLADLKNRLGPHRGYFRGFGIRSYTLLAGFHPRRPEHRESARLGHPARGSRFLGAVPRRA